MGNMLDVHAATSQDDEAALLLGMAAKTLTQLQSHGDRVTAEAMEWRDTFEQVGQLCQQLEDERDVLLEENERLLVKCQQLEACQQMDGVVEENEYSEFESVPAEALLEVSAVQDTGTTTAHRRSFTGNVYNQLNEFELSLDMELEDFQKLGLFSSSDNENNTSCSDANEGEQTYTSSHASPVGVTSCQIGTMTPVRDTSVRGNVLGTSKGSSVLSSRNPIHLLRRMFQTQDDDIMPAMATSDSLFSFSSDCSISQSSMSDLPGFTPIKRATKLSPQPNAEWGIIE